MNGFKAFKYYTALKLHFTNPRFDVFVNRGHVKGSYEKFLERNDRSMFERLARQFDDKDYIQYIASNFMYGNSEMIYHSEDAMTNYKEFLRRRQSITRVFDNDLQLIINSGAQYEFSGQKIPDVVQLFMAKKITLETMTILNDMDDIVNKMRQNGQLSLLLSDDLLRIEKSKGFVKWLPEKVEPLFTKFKQDSTSSQHQ